MRTATSDTIQRLNAAKRTVTVTTTRLKNAHTPREREELEGVLDRARHALRSAERDVAVERAKREFGRRLRRVTAELSAPHDGNGGADG